MGWIKRNEECEEPKNEHVLRAIERRERWIYSALQALNGSLDKSEEDEGAS
jgi:hypothetical protein